MSTGFWDALLIRIMRQGKHETEAQTKSSEPLPDRIESEQRIASVLGWYPQTESVFLRYGFDAVKNPFLLRTVARQVSIARACALHGQDINAFVKDLNKVIADQPDGASTAFGSPPPASTPASLTVEGRTLN